MTPEQEKRLRELATSTVVGGDIAAALAEIDRLRASSPPSAEPLPDELEKWKAAYHDMELVAADKTLEVIKLEKLLQQPSPPPSDALREAREWLQIKAMHIDPFDPEHAPIRALLAAIATEKPK